MYNEQMSAINDKSINAVISKTFIWMFIGILVTACISWGMYTSGKALEYVHTFNTIGIINLAVAVIFGFLSSKLSTQTCTLLFLVYSALNGVTLSVIYYIYELESIAMILLAAAGLFGAFGYLGYNSKKDLTNMGSMLGGVLLVAILVSIVNYFLGNSMLDTILSWVILLAFFGITAYDLQKIKALAETYPDDDKIHVRAAFDLYLDFINIFLRLLMLFGKAKD